MREMSREKERKRTGEAGEESKLYQKKQKNKKTLTRIVKNEI